MGWTLSCYKTAQGARALKTGVRNSAKGSALLASVTDVREVALMRAILMALVVLAVLVAISFVGFFGVITPLATAAILLVPATFMVSLVIGFASRRRSWFG